MLINNELSLHYDVAPGLFQCHHTETLTWAPPFDGPEKVRTRGKGGRPPINYPLFFIFPWGWSISKLKAPTDLEDPVVALSWWWMGPIDHTQVVIFLMVTSMPALKTQATSTPTLHSKCEWTVPNSPPCFETRAFKRGFGLRG